MIRDNVCKQGSSSGYVCSLREGHDGKVHVALGGNDFVYEVWEEVEVTKTVTTTEIKTHVTKKRF